MMAKLEARFTIAPPSAILASASRQKRKGARRCTFRKKSSVSSSVSSTGSGLPTPALLTSQSSRPNRPIAKSAAREGASAAVTSAARTVISAEPASSSRSTSSGSAERPTATTAQTLGGEQPDQRAADP